MKPTKIILSDRVNVTLHPVLRKKGVVVADKLGLSFSEYLQELIRRDLENPTPSPYLPQDNGGKKST